MKKRISLCMILISLFLCSQTVSADLVWGPPIMNSEFVQTIGLAPLIISVIAATLIIIWKINTRK